MERLKNNGNRFYSSIGLSIALCVSITVFFWMNGRVYTDQCVMSQAEKNLLMHKSTDRQFSNIDDKVLELKIILNEVRVDLKLLKEKLK